MAKKLTYKSAGVDIDRADGFVHAIGPLVRSTHRPGVVGRIGGFSGLFRVPRKGMTDPILVASTDGVGTKLLVAKAVGKHDTVGIDLVAMCANDVITCGAEPLFFLDYIATGKIAPEQALQIMKGIAAGCRQAGCAILGGETAEMPGLYARGDYDLAGFCVGVVDRAKMLDGRRVRVGDPVLGLASNGLHSNGFSLVRKVFSKKELRSTLGRRLLKPTTLYVKPVLALSKAGVLRGAANITGGGFYDNIPRCLPKGRSVRVDRSAWRVPSVFREIQKRGRIDDREMFRTFNMGVGMVAVVGPDDVARAQRILSRHHVKSMVIGEVVRGSGDVLM